jgi:hypothetical protein
VFCNQLLKIGDCYLIQCQAEACSSDPVMAFPSLKANKIVVSSHNPIWSLSIASYHQITKQSGHQNSIFSVNDYNTPPLSLQFYDMNEPANINYGEKGRSSIGWHGQTSSVNLRDVMLYIPCGAIVIIQDYIKHVKANMIPITMGVYDAFEKCLACRSIVDTPPQFSKATVSDNGTKFEGNLPEGELISLHGEVKDVLCKELNPFLKENRFSCKCLSADISSIFIPKVMYTIHIQGLHGSEKVGSSFVICVSGKNSSTSHYCQTYAMHFSFLYERFSFLIWNSGFHTSGIHAFPLVGVSLRSVFVEYSTNVFCLLDLDQK